MSIIFTLRMDSITHDRLVALAQRTQRTRASVVRWLLHEKAGELSASPIGPTPIEGKFTSGDKQVIEIENEGGSVCETKI